MQEFDLDFASAKSKKSLIFAELISDLSSKEEEEACEDTFFNEHIFLISNLDPTLDIIIYLQTLKVPTHLSQDEQRILRHVSKSYLIVDKTLYHRGVDSILRCCLTHEKAELVLNDFHEGVCGSHLSRFSIAQKSLRAGYF